MSEYPRSAGSCRDALRASDEERSQAAYSARTPAELDGLRRDLSTTPRFTTRDGSERRTHLSRRLMQETGGSAADRPG